MAMNRGSLRLSYRRKFCDKVRKAINDVLNNSAKKKTFGSVIKELEGNVPTPIYNMLINAFEAAEIFDDDRLTDSSIRRLLDACDEQVEEALMEN